MQLISLKMNDFRQYKGQQALQFSTNDKNVTVIIGVNGKGKTGIYRAMMFGLFGQLTLAQDKKGADIKLVNLDQLQNNIGDQVLGSVEIVFLHEDQRYTITRKNLGSMSKIKKVTERSGESNLVIEDLSYSKLRQEFSDDLQIKMEIGKVIDESIREFFFFDGERVSSLAETDKEMRKAVRLGIEKLLEIDKLSTIQIIANKEYSKLQKKLTQESNDVNLVNLEKTISGIKKEINETKACIHNKEEEQILCSQMVKEIETKLDKNKEIVQISMIIKEQAATLNACDEHLKSTKSTISNTLFHLAPSYLTEDLGVVASGYLDQLIESKDELIPKELIQQILAEKICICGQPIDESNELFNVFQDLLTRTNYSEKMQLIGQIKGHVQDVTLNKNQFRAELFQHLKTIRTKKDEMKTLVSSLKDLEYEKKQLSISEVEYRNLYSTLESKRSDLSLISTSIIKLNLILEQNESQLEEREKEYTVCVSKNEKLNNEIQKLDLLKRLDESLKEFNNNFIKEMSKHLTEETTQLLKRIIQRSDVETIDRVCINEHFELSITFDSGVDMSDDISKGQREMVALAFVTALAKAASNNPEIIDFPLFMDTPFGRLSSENRENLLRSIPELTSQWILLTTDTEMTTVEQSVLFDTNKVGKTYKINMLNKYHSVLEEII